MNNALTITSQHVRTAAFCKRSHNLPSNHNCSFWPPTGVVTSRKYNKIEKYEEVLSSSDMAVLQFIGVIWFKKSREHMWW